MQIQGQLQRWLAVGQLFWLLHICPCFPLMCGFAALCCFLCLLCSCLAFYPVFTHCSTARVLLAEGGWAGLPWRGVECCSSAWLTRQSMLSASLFAADLLLMSFWSVCRHLWLSKARSFCKCEYCQKLDAIISASFHLLRGEFRVWNTCQLYDRLRCEVAS